MRILYGTDHVFPSTAADTEQLYLAAGRAIFAPRAPDTTELLVHDENACLVTPGDARRAAHALRGLLDDAARQARLAAAARALAESLTWDARAEKLQAFLKRRLAATPRGKSPTPEDRFGM